METYNRVTQICASINRGIFEKGPSWKTCWSCDSCASNILAF